TYALFERLQADEPARRDVDSIQRAAQRAASLVQQLLAFARKQPLQPWLVDLNQLVTGLSLSTVAGERIELSMRLEETLRPTSVDRGQFLPVILSLVESERYAMPGGGCLVSETSYVDMDDVCANSQ